MKGLGNHPCLRRWNELRRSPDAGRADVRRSLPLVEAWARVHGDDRAAWVTARRRFLDGLTHHLSSAGLGHVSEIADGDRPHRPAGCPFQAWSLAELMRIETLAGAESRKPEFVG